MAIKEAQFPEKTRFLFNPHRYKVLYGGRGGGKSYAAARALLLKGISSKHRILCTREVQKTIKDSVHKLLCDQIVELGLNEYYEPLQTEIRCKNGTEFIFAGLADQTVTSIKSLEGCSIVWCEEAQAITKRSWDILIPTIRKDDSEIWITFNPELETDETYVRFIKNKSDDAMVVKLNYKDNPWFNDVLEKERLKCKQNDPDNYDNIWEGMCKPAVAGAIYYKQIAEAERNGRICNLPYNPMLKVHLVTDIGKGDSLFVALVQVHMSAIQIIESIDGGFNDWNDLSVHLKDMKLNWGKWWLPHDGYTGTINSGGRSTEDILKKIGWEVAPRHEIVQLSVEEGIRNAKLQFHRMYFDIKYAASLIECAKRYRRHISRTTNTETNPLADSFAHGGDTIRYIAANADKMKNESEAAPQLNLSGLYTPRDRAVGI